jgi:hypothetical protein
VLDVLVVIPPLLVHPSAVFPLHRRARRPAPPRAAVVRRHRRPGRLRTIRAAGPPIYGPDQFDPESNYPVPVNPKTTARIEPQPLDLDPMDQIHPYSFTRAFLFKKP